MVASLCNAKGKQYHESKMASAFARGTRPGDEQSARAGAGDTGDAQASSPGWVVETRALTRLFRGNVALDAVSLHIPGGAIFGFLGPNGAGKTTTLRILLGLLKPTSGTACVLGFDPLTEGDEVRARVGVVLDKDGLYERLSAHDNLLYYCRIYHLPATRAQARMQELLEAMGLWERRHERVGGWSRGMRQRLALARALLAEPTLLLLDEPSAGLDPASAVELRERVRNLAEERGTTVFLTTHNLDEAERICSLVGIISKGKLVAIDTPERLRQTADHVTLRVTASPVDNGVVQELNNLASIRQAWVEAGDLMLIPAEGAAANDALLLLLQRGVTVEEMHRITPRLEEVYLSLVEESR